MAIRVVRVLEYTYEDVKYMEMDQRRWLTGTNGSVDYSWVKIRSATLPLEVLDDEQQE